MKALEQHLLLQDHFYFSKPEDIHKTSDEVKILFSQKLKDAKIDEILDSYLTSSIGNDCTSTSWRNGGSVHPLEDGKTMGWALRKRRKDRFSEKHIRFLVDMYEGGETMKKKRKMLQLLLTWCNMPKELTNRNYFLLQSTWEGSKFHPFSVGSQQLDKGICHSKTCLVKVAILKMLTVTLMSVLKS